MEKSKLFEYAIIWHPNKEEEKSGEKSKIVVKPTVVLASSQTVAQMMAVKAIPSEYEEKFEQLDIALRPF